MSNNYFQFKQFLVLQDKCAMKVGTDGVLLGAWTEIGNSLNILDVGSGTGLIAMMMGQRSNAMIDAIEIEENAFIQARENISGCKWKDRIKLFHTSFQEYSVNCRQQYDLIISNPPYFNNSLKAPDKERSLARHSDSLSFADLVNGSLKILNKSGRLSVILPVDQAKVFLEATLHAGLFCSRRTLVKPNKEKSPVRFLLEFVREKIHCREDELTIELGRHCYTNDYINLTKEFYLNF
jgi:tRNA1Val (adenine37-N6)-methyltransferase